MEQVVAAVGENHCLALLLPFLTLSDEFVARVEHSHAGSTTIIGIVSRILIRATNWVGDAVMSLPALQAIRERFPEAYISVLARPWVADIYARERFADEVIPYTAPRGWK